MNKIFTFDRKRGGEVSGANGSGAQRYSQSKLGV